MPRAPKAKARKKAATKAKSTPKKKAKKSVQALVRAATRTKPKKLAKKALKKTTAKVATKKKTKTVRKAAKASKVLSKAKKKSAARKPALKKTKATATKRPVTAKKTKIAAPKARQKRGKAAVQESAESLASHDYGFGHSHDDEQAESPEDNDESEESEGGPAAAAGEIPAPGTRAPDFALHDESGSLVQLKELRGQHVVLFFYPKDDTPGCTTEALGFRESYAAFANASCVLLGVSGDSADSHCRFIEKHDLPFQLLVDKDNKLAESYGVWIEKNMYGRKYMGIQRATFLISPEGLVHKVWPRVHVGGHAAEVLAALALA